MLLLFVSNYKLLIHSRFSFEHGIKIEKFTLCFHLPLFYFQKIATCDKDIYTAPVFRSRPDTAAGFLPGGFWKYSAKPSNILPFNEDPMDDETEGKHTIQDDVVVAGQDFTAGLVRMGILPRLRYLLEVKIN